MFKNKILLSAVILSGMFLTFSPKSYADTVEVNDYSELKQAIDNAVNSRTLDIKKDISDIQSGFELKNGKDIIINGNGNSLISNGSKHLVFDVKGNLTINDAVLKNYSNNGWGGTLYNEGNVVLNKVSFQNNTENHSGVGGGAIGNYIGGVVDVTGSSSFLSNKNANKYGKGGAIDNRGTINFTNDETEVTTFQNNSSVYFGGAIYNEGSINFNGNYVFDNNTAANADDADFRSYGGAIYNTGTISAEGALTFSNNTASAVGGAIYNSGVFSFGNSNGQTTLFSGNTSNSEGGAIYNSGTLTLFGDYKFIDNKSNNYNGGAIFNAGIMSLEGSYLFKNNSSNNKGGALYNYVGSVNITGTRDENGDASVVFDGNSTVNRGGAIFVEGKEGTHAFLNIKSADFKNNTSNTHGGAIYIDNYVSFNIEDSKFFNNTTGKSNQAWGGALGLASEKDNVYGFVKDSVFENNFSGNSGGAIPGGTSLTIVNSKFMGNHAAMSAGAVSYNPRRGLEDKAFTLIANGGDTVFSNNWVGDYTSTRTAENSEGLYFGNAIVGADGKAVTGADGNDSNIYFNAGNSGNIIINDIVNALGDAYDDVSNKKPGGNPDYARADVNNPNIQLNKAGIHYSKFTATQNNADDTLAPTNGTIIFNNMLKGANLVLHNGTLAFGRANDYEGYLTPAKYFDDTAKITLKGGTLDLTNENIESKESGIFNPASLDVLGNANLRLDVNLTDCLIDYINADIQGNGILTIDKLSFGGDLALASFDLGDTKKLQFAKSNSLAEGKTILEKNLETVITSNAGYSLALATTTKGKDSISVTKFVDAGGLPVALSLGQDEELSSARTYVYNATSDEVITESGGENAWDKGYNVLLDTIEKRKTSNKLRGELLQVNGNNKNIITSDNIIGIELGVENGKTQKLIINDVRKTDGTGWKGFNSAIINHGGTVDLNNSIFSDNNSSVILNEDSSIYKYGNGGALYNESGIINILNTDFKNNSATDDGGAIYNSGTVNIKSDNTNSLVFSGNTVNGNANDIYNSGVLNLATANNSSITFNGGISGNGSGVLNIGYDNNQNAGTVIFNNTIANQSVFLNNGTLQLGSNATKARNDYFNNVDLTLNGGSFSLKNGYIDTVNVNDFTVGANNPQLILDVDLSGDVSDSIFVNNTYTNNGKLYIGPVNIISAMAEGANTSVITYINKEVNADIEDVNKYITVDGITYAISVDKNKLYITQEGKSGGFAYEVINTARADRTYTIGSNDEIVDKWIAGDNKLAGLRFQVLGGSKGKSLIAQNGISGIFVSEKDQNPQELTISGVTSWQGFDSAIINEGGKINITNTKFEKNNSTTDGGVVRNNLGVVNINGGTVLANNSAAGSGGAVYNAVNGVVNLNADNSKNIEFTGNTALKGGDIYSDGTVNVTGTGSVIFNGGIDGSGVMNIKNAKTVVNASLIQNTLNISNGSVLNMNASNLTIANLLKNDGTIQFTGGTNSNNITGSGLTQIAGTVINNANIGQNVSIASNGNLTSALENISGTLTNSGIFNLTDNLSKDISGAGETILNNEILITENKTVEGTLNLNGQTVDMQGNDDSSYSTLNTGNLKGSGDLKINVNMNNVNGKAENSDKINITSGSKNNAVLNLIAINVSNDVDASANPYKNYVDYVTGNKTGIDYRLDGSVAGSIIAVTANNRYTFTKGDDGSLDVFVENLAAGLREYINGTLVADSYSINEDYTMEDSLEIGTTAGNKTKNVFINNGSSLIGFGGTDGITVADGYTLNLTGSPADDKSAAMSNFETALINSANGTINVENMSFANNTVDIKNDGTLNLTGVNSFADGITGLGTTNILEGKTVAGAKIQQNAMNILTDAVLNSNADNLDIANGIANSGLIELTGGSLNSAISGSGKTNIDGNVIANALISNEITVNSSNSLTANASYLGNAVTNEAGSLILTGGTLNNNVKGAGSAIINGDVTFADLIDGVENKITINQSAKLTSNAEKLGAEDVLNSGKLVLTGYNATLKNSLKGAGALDIAGNIIAEALIENTISINDDNSLQISADNIGNVVDTNISGLLNITGGTLAKSVNGSGITEINGDVSVSDLGFVNNNLQILNGKLTSNAGNLGSNDILNNAVLELIGGNLGNNVNGSGTITINGDVTNNDDKTLAQKLLNINNGTSFKSAADKISFTDGISNLGTLTLTGENVTNTNTIFGDGLLRIQGDLIQKEGVKISNVTEITSGSSLTAIADDLLGTVNNESGSLKLSGGTLNSLIDGNGNTFINGDVVSNAIIRNEITINGNNSLTTDADKIENNVKNETGSLVLNDGILSNNVTGNGNTVIAGAVDVVTGSILNKITVNEHSILTSNAENLGSFDITNNGILKFTGGNISNNITNGSLANSGKLDIVGTVTNTDNKNIKQNGIDISENGNFTTSIGALDISGVINDNGILNLIGNASNGSAITGSGILNISGNLNQTGNLDVAVSNIIAGGVLDIKAGMLGSETINNAGTIKLGDGILSKVISGSGNVEINAGSTVSSSLNNVASASSFVNNGNLNLTGDIIRDIDGDGVTTITSDTTKVNGNYTIAGILDMNGKTIDMQDTPTKYTELNVGTLTGSGNLKIDADMAKNAQGTASASDRLNIGSAVAGTILNLSDIKVTNAMAAADRGSYADYLTYATGDLSNVEQQLAGMSGSDAKFTTTDGLNQYIFTLGSDGKLNAEIDHIAISLKEYVEGSTDYAKTLNSFNVNSDMTITSTIGETAEGDSRTGGTSLRININNGSNIKATGDKTLDGITVANGYELNLDGSNADGAKMSGFKTALVNNGTLNIDSVTFDGNETDIVNNSTLNLDGKNEFNSGIKGDNGVTNVKTGITNANASIIQKVINIFNGAALKGNADNFVASSGIKNEGVLDLTGGTLKSNVDGNGILNISEDSSIFENTTVSQIRTAVADGKTLTNNGELNTSLDLKNGQNIAGNGSLNLKENSRNEGNITQNTITNEAEKTFINNGNVNSSSFVNKGNVANNSETSMIVADNITNEENAMLKSTANGIVAANGVKNDGGMELTGGNLASNINGNGITLISGNVTNNSGKTIAQKIFAILTGGLFETDADKISAENDIIKNDGTLNFTGNAQNGNAVYGDGITVISGDITQKDGKELATNIKIKNSGALTAGANDIQGDVDKEADSKLTLKSGTLNKNITGQGTTVIDGSVLANGEITQDNLEINSESQFVAKGEIKSNIDNKGTAVSDAKITGNIQNSGTLTANDEIVGTITNTDGVLNLNGAVNGGIHSSNGVLNLGSAMIEATASQPLNALTLDSSLLNMADGTIGTLSVHEMNLLGENKLKLDADLAKKQIDKIQIKDLQNSVINPASTITISDVKLMSDATVKKLSLSIFADVITKNALINNIRANLKGVQYSSIYKYDVDYDKINGLVNFNRYSTGSYSDFNPSVLAGPVAAQVGGFLTQVNVYEQAFANMDMNMLMTKEQRQAMKFANKYASSQGTAEGGVVSFSPNQTPEQSKGLWFRPFATFENVELKNGPKVGNTAYGSLFGGDSDLIELSHGWDMVYSLYAGYVGSHQTYNGVGIYQNGGTLGTSAVWYKDNFFTGLTANVASSIAEASAMYGSEDFALLSTGIASKSGYNFEFADGKFIVQPNYLMSYTFVNTFDYTNAAGVRIKSDPLNAIQIAPGVKFIGNLGNGWQPYLGAQMIWTLMDKTDFKANDVSLPDLSVKPYVQYGVGLQKKVGDNFTAFGQTMIRNGGRNGISLQFGLRWTLGKKH